MGITDIFKAKQFKSDIERLQAENEYLQSLLSPELKDLLNIKRHIDTLNSEKETICNELSVLTAKKENLSKQLLTIENEINKKKKNIIFLDDEILFQDFSLYTPVYDLTNSELYKDKLLIVREKQKQMIKSNTAVHFPTNFTFNNSLAQGKKVIADNVKQILRSFNNECEVIIDKVKFSNVEAIRKRILKSYEDLNRLNGKLSISIKHEYLELKLQEMNLCYEYSIKKQEEKEEAKRIREEQREAQKLQREIEEARKSSEKEQQHYKNALSKISAQLQNATSMELDVLLAKKHEIESHLKRISDELDIIDYREANQRAGYVYVISNIGSFGENVYKIGMTRRLDPMDRVEELGDASVPFKFDVHALIFCDDAPALESALHRAFDSRKLNMVNTRREFFHVSLEEIEQVVKNNYDKTVEFTKLPTAEQFRESQMMRRGLKVPEYHREEYSGTFCAKPDNQMEHAPSKQQDTHIKRCKKCLHTKWGTYEMPDPYKINMAYGPRKDLKEV